MLRKIFLSFAFVGLAVIGLTGVWASNHESPQQKVAIQEPAAILPLKHEGCHTNSDCDWQHGWYCQWDDPNNTTVEFTCI